MEKLNDLNDLLKHEIQDLHSAEEQIIKAMPAMIEKAKNPELKQSLIQHLRITEAQLGRVEQVQNIMNDGNGDSSDAEEKRVYYHVFSNVIMYAKA
jgi:ferritin-like metal-binding protein YciE